MKRNFLVTLLLIAFITVSAQNKKDKVLLTIDGQPVYTSEFLRVYNKNRDIVSDENKKNIDEYLDLFINYKLKLKEAKDLKLDTIPSYIKEFNKYKKQLIEPYLKDREVTEELMKEAYARMKKEVKASHILISLPKNASPNDTLKAYNTIIEARNKILNGEKFEDVAKKYSKDPSAKKNGGNLGYFGAFAMVYPFETAAYNTKKGDVSMPFRTRYGYHIVKVNDIRDSQGEVQVAHIMIKEKKDDAQYAKRQINDIYNKIKEGESFDKMAKQFSEDKSTAIKGGVLRRFSYGNMIPEFAEVAFSLEKKGDVSKPFKTKFGWHIVKLIKKYPVQSYDKVKDFIAKKVERGDRAVVVGRSMAKKLQNKYQAKVNQEALNNYLENKKDNSIDSKTVFSIKDKNYSVSDLKNYLKKNRTKTYQNFFDEKTLEYYKEHLADENPEFANTLQEYQDGLLLFDLLQKKIWNKAEEDTIGLKEFYTKNIQKYKWKKRVDADIASCTKKEKAELVKKYLEEGKTTKEIKDLVNEGPTIHVLFTSGKFEIDSKKLPKNLEIKEGVSKIFKDKNNDFKIVRIKKIIPESTKEFENTKGKVISDYQEYLEKEWIIDLHNKYKVNVNKKTLKKIKKKYK